MKRTIAIVSICLATVLILAGVFTILASTNVTAPTLSIKGKNLSFSDSVYIVYYVEATDVKAEDVNLLVWNSAKDSYTVKDSPKKLSYIRTETIDGKDYLRFEYRDLAAKNMTDTIYARAYVSAGNKDYYSDLTNYSVLQYAYNKLGKTGTATQDENLKEFLIDMLEYGAAAQVKFNHKADRLATASFKQISVEGGHLSDLCNRGLFLENDTVVITADVPSGKTFAGWKNDAGTIVSTSASYTVTVGGANAKYTAVFN